MCQTSLILHISWDLNVLIKLVYLLVEIFLDSPSPMESFSSCFHQLPFTVAYYVIAEKVMAPHSSTLAWKTPWAEEPGGLQSVGSQRVRHD